MASNVLRKMVVFGVALSFIVLMVASTKYPGGYVWYRNYISQLFWPTTPLGVQNPARPIACVGIVFYCVSMAILFQLIAKQGHTKLLRKLIQTGGIGSMVYASFTITVLHDLMVTIALCFFLTFMAAVLAMLYSQRDLRMFLLGIMTLGVVLACAVMYYGNMLVLYLPLMQKMTMAMSTAWLFAVMYRNRDIHISDSASSIETSSAS